ncbi:SDR family oxidoreductase [Mucilaginibacter jinjuensis]|uniref:SDR family oxidoreductase n=1 Tax=Mucilaginibacter jinjuensis TaxID=1176721 RepID=A0ABY7T6V9_9SPHI|nr:SDR family oxidoreductase [Mucilaginibacter jinjuensis]WCT12086.1 SDR family oxidoreductase [Mucilaginibacter jinjuensis]
MKNSTVKTAIVTGASRGIGKAIAIKLAANGYQVVVNYANSEAEAQRVVAQIEQAGGIAIAVQADVSKIQQFENLFDMAEKTYGPVDVLINNAGVSKLSPIADSDDDLFDYLFNINVRGTVNGLKLAAKRLSQGGRIVNFSSTAVATSTPGMGLYVGTKAAVEAITKVFVKELRGRQITVNMIAPGLIQSEMFFEGKTAAQIAQMEKLSPLERFGSVDEVADAVAYLVSEDAGWVNGLLIRVNGGVA